MSSILVVESEGLITRLLERTLGSKEYQAVMILDCEGAVQFALRETPSLVIIDSVLPGVDSYELVQRLRSQPKCMHIPIIMLSSYGSLAEKVRAYELGVDSFITKPYNDDELLAHVRRQLLRVLQNSLSPLTRLPGGLQLEYAIKSKLSSLEPWSLLYLDLDNFKAFNDVYGFLKGNDMILLVGHICQRVVYEYGNPDDFIGHVGGDDFVIVTTPEREKILCRRIIALYKEESAVLYRQEDLERGTISGLDRKGRPYQFPLVSLSIGIVSGKSHDSQSVDEVGTLAAEAKRNAKQSSDNVFHLTPRPDSSFSQSSLSYTPPPVFSASHTSKSISQFARNIMYRTEEDTLAKFK